MSKVKLVYVLGTLNVGGIEKWVANFINYCRQKNYDYFDFYIISLDKDKKDILNEIDINEENVYITSKNSLSARLSVIKKVIFEVKPNCFHLHPGYSTGMYAFFIKLISSATVIIHSHSDRSRVESKASVFRKSYINIMKYLISQFSDLRLAVSKKAGDSLFNSNYVVKNCGVPDIEVDTSEVISELKGKNNIFHIGRDSEAKNYPFIIDLVKEFSGNKNFNFVLIGGGLSKYEQEIKELGFENVTFLGFVDNPAKVLKLHEGIFIMPSLWEGLPLSAVEAQKSELYCLLSETITRECDIGAAKYLPLDTKVWHDEIVNIFECDKKVIVNGNAFSLERDYCFYKDMIVNDN